MGAVGENVHFVGDVVTTQGGGIQITVDDIDAAVIGSVPQESGRGGIVHQFIAGEVVVYVFLAFSQQIPEAAYMGYL